MNSQTSLAGQISSSQPDGRRIVVTFYRTHDRYSHVISVQTDASTQAVFASLEGQPDEVCPPSPAFQQMSIEHRAVDRSVALLVGMAGKCHYSAGVEAIPDAGKIVFDVACRMEGEAVELGSSYLLEAPAGTSPCHLVVDDIHSQLTTRRDVVQVSQREALIPPCTARWRYEIAFRSEKHIEIA